MTDIDLTPDKMKASQLRRRRIRIWYAFLVLTIVATGAWTLINYLGYRRENHNAQLITQENQKLKDGIQSLSQVRSQIDLWQDRLALMQELDSYGDLVKITDYLTQQSPQLIYLDQMSFIHPEKTQNSTALTTTNKSAAAEMFNTKESPKTETANPAPVKQEPILMSLTGHAVDYKSVADFLNTLSAAQLIAEPQLKFSRRQLTAAPEMKDIIDFEIEAQLVLTPSFPGVHYANLQKTKDI